MKSSRIAVVRELYRSGIARTLRTSAGVSLAELAADAGVTPAAIHGFEQGRYLPRGETALRLFYALKELDEVRRHAHA